MQTSLRSYYAKVNYERYVTELSKQRRTPPMHASKRGGIPVELRYRTKDNPNGAWLWFASKYAAGRWLFNDNMFEQSRIHRIVTRPLPTRFDTRNECTWLGRLARNSTPPGLRIGDWSWFRRVWLPTWRIAFYWLNKTVVKSCAPGGSMRKRDREAFEADFRSEEEDP